MCMISGYIGDDEALPHLIGMMRRQEFVFGGFYTGIATANAGVLHRKRTVGAISSFCSQCSEGELSGPIGIAHSRTNDGGGIEWAQPRYSEENAIASVGVGIDGVLASPAKTLAIAKELALEGTIFNTRIDSSKKNGIYLPGGCVIHSGEVSLILLARLYSKGYSILESIRKLNIRSESVDLLLTRQEPDRLFVINHNSRLLVVRTANATFLSSSRLAIIDDPVWTIEIPPNSFAIVTKDDVSLEVLWCDEPRFDLTRPRGLTGRVLKYLGNHPGRTWGDVFENAIVNAFPNDKATLGFPLAHQVIEQLLAEEKIRFEIREVIGVDGQFPVPQMILFRS